MVLGSDDKNKHHGEVMFREPWRNGKPAVVMDR